MLVKIIKSDKVAINCRQNINFEKDKIEEVDDNVGKILIELGIAILKDDNSELEVLRVEAKELKIKGSNMMKIDTIKKAIKAKKAEDEKKAEKALSSLENKAITNINNKNN